MNRRPQLRHRGFIRSGWLLDRQQSVQRRLRLRPRSFLCVCGSLDFDNLVLGDKPLLRSVPHRLFVRDIRHRRMPFDQPFSESGAQGNVKIFPCRTGAENSKRFGGTVHTFPRISASGVRRATVFVKHLLLTGKVTNARSFVGASLHRGFGFCFVACSFLNRAGRCAVNWRAEHIQLSRPKFAGASFRHGLDLDVAPSQHRLLVFGQVDAETVLDGNTPQGKRLCERVLNTGIRVGRANSLRSTHSGEIERATRGSRCPLRHASHRNVLTLREYSDGRYNRFRLCENRFLCGSEPLTVHVLLVVHALPFREFARRFFLFRSDAHAGQIERTLCGTVTVPGCSWLVCRKPALDEFTDRSGVRHSGQTPRYCLFNTGHRGSAPLCLPRRVRLGRRRLRQQVSLPPTPQTVFLRLDVTDTITVSAEADILEAHGFRRVVVKRPLRRRRLAGDTTDELVPCCLPLLGGDTTDDFLLELLVLSDLARVNEAYGVNRLGH